VSSQRTDANGELTAASERSACLSSCRLMPRDRATEEVSEEGGGARGRGRGQQLGTARPAASPSRRQATATFPDCLSNHLDDLSFLRRTPAAHMFDPDGHPLIGSDKARVWRKSPNASDCLHVDLACRPGPLRRLGESAWPGSPFRPHLPPPPPRACPRTRPPSRPPSRSSPTTFRPERLRWPSCLPCRPAARSTPPLLRSRPSCPRRAGGPSGRPAICSTTLSAGSRWAKPGRTYV